MTKPKGVVDADARVQRWYEGWKALIGLTILTIMIFGAGMKFNDWMFGMYTQADADAEHRALAVQDSLLTFRVSTLEKNFEELVATFGDVLFQFFCYQRRALTQDPEIAWEICVRPDTRERIEALGEAVN